MLFAEPLELGVVLGAPHAVVLHVATNGAATRDRVEVSLAAFAQQLEAGERVDVAHAEVAVAQLGGARLGIAELARSRR